MERSYEKYGWVIFLFLGILWFVVGFTQTSAAFKMEAVAEKNAQHVAGMSLNKLDASSPMAYVMICWLYGNLGLLKIGWSVFLIAVTLTGYRKGEKWAWYTLWLAPVQLVGAGIFNSVFFGDISEMFQWIPITTISLIGLLLPYRKFFPK